jgi:hypothetical protein
VGQKAEYALSKGLSVIACIGELLEDRQAGHTFDVIFAQLKALAGAFTEYVVARSPRHADQDAECACLVLFSAKKGSGGNWMRWQVDLSAESAPILSDMLVQLVDLESVPPPVLVEAVDHALHSRLRL